MLKKAGIVVATATAGLLALSPLAFATTDHHEGEHHSHQDHSRTDVDYTNVERDNLTNDCAFGQEGPDVRSSATGGSSLLGAANLVTSVIAPVTAQTQALNCNNINVSDVVDFDSNNSTRTATRTDVDDSFNTEG